MNSKDELLNSLLELKRRREATNSLLKFTEYTLPQYEAAYHHTLICDKLEAVERGEIDRLMIEMPPRHGKSELASKRFPAWFMGRNPSKQIITTSCTADLATSFGREVRNIVSDTSYSNVFDTQLSVDSKAAGRWNTSHGGVYIAAGVGGTIIGKGAHVALIDDPVKDRKSADSETDRDTVYNWYRGTLYHRLMPGGAIVLISTRWHEDDLSGRLLRDQERGGDQWEVLKLPAISDEGEALWSAWYDLKALNRIKAAIGPRDFSALYQQNPTPDEGTYFKRDDFFRYDVESMPAVRKYQTADFAVTDEAEADDPDYTEIGIHGTRRASIEVPGDDGVEIADVTKLYLCIDGWSGRKEPHKWVHEYFNLTKRHKPMAEFAEVGVIRRAVEGILKQQRLVRKAYGEVEWVSHIGDKSANARALQALSQMGLVGLPNTEYGDYVLDQLLKFPAGKYDDAVDMCALIGRAIYEAWPQITKQSDEPKRRDRWDKAFDDDTDDWMAA